MTAEESLAKLKTGAAAYAASGAFSGDVSEAVRQRTAEGQHPFATVVTCSDSRVIPEAIFSCGIGDIFVIRTAGSVIGAHELASIEYAAHHLHVPLTVVLGHTHCGAVGAAGRALFCTFANSFCRKFHCSNRQRKWIKSFSSTLNRSC